MNYNEAIKKTTKEYLDHFQNSMEECNSIEEYYDLVMSIIIFSNLTIHHLKDLSSPDLPKEEIEIKVMDLLINAKEISIEIMNNSKEEEGRDLRLN